jgi:hypothetical protein
MNKIQNSQPPHPSLSPGGRGMGEGQSFGIENWNLFGIWNLSFGI